MPRPSRWPSETVRYAALGHIDPARWPTIEADLALVDALEARLEAMPLEQPDRRPMTAADPLRQLLDHARQMVVTWHAHDERRRPTVIPPATP